jgi:archaellum component FlaC
MDKRNIDTINELKLWIEGKFELVNQQNVQFGDDIRTIRTRLHDLSNDVAKLNAIDFLGLNKRIEEHDSELEGFTKEAAERKGAIAALKATYAIGGAIVGAASSAVLFFSRVLH